MFLRYHSSPKCHRSSSSSSIRFCNQSLPWPFSESHWTTTMFRGRIPARIANTGLLVFRRLQSSEAGRRVAALWGNGDYGRLGLGSLESRWRPAVCSPSAFENQNLKAIACGGAHTLFLTGCFCSNRLLISPSQFVNCLVEQSLVDYEVWRNCSSLWLTRNTSVLTDSGRVYATGLNDFGQLGISEDRAYATVKFLGFDLCSSVFPWSCR